MAPWPWAGTWPWSWPRSRTPPVQVLSITRACFKDGELFVLLAFLVPTFALSLPHLYRDAAKFLLAILRPHRIIHVPVWRTGKEKERKSIYIALFWPRWYAQSAQAWTTQFYLQITPCLPFLHERSPDVTTTATEAADIQLQLATHLSTPKGWKAELA